MRTKVVPIVVLAALIMSVAASADTADRRYIMPPAPADNRPAPPFSEGILIGGTYYVAGHVGLDPATQKPPATVDAEAHAVLDAVQKTLKDAGLTMDDLVSVTVYCTDLGLYDGFNAVYRGYFHDQFPTRAFIGVKDLVRGAHFEVQGIAVAPAKPPKH